MAETSISSKMKEEWGDGKDPIQYAVKVLEQNNSSERIKGSEQGRRKAS